MNTRTGPHSTHTSYTLCYIVILLIPIIVAIVKKFFCVNSNNNNTLFVVIVIPKLAVTIFPSIIGNSNILSCGDSNTPIVGNRDMLNCGNSSNNNTLPCAYYILSPSIVVIHVVTS